MTQFYKLSISIHVGIVYLLLIVSFFTFLILKNENSKKTYTYTLPLYYGLLAALAFTGVVVYFALNFNFGHLVIFMMFCWAYILYSTIKTYKKAKNATLLSKEILKNMRINYLSHIAIYIAFIIFKVY